MQFWTIARKDLKILRRDRTALIFTFGMPLILTFIFGSVYGGGKNSSAGVAASIPVLVANLDQGELGGKVEEAMGNAGLKIEKTGDPAALRQRIEKGDYPVGVTIPQGFTTQLKQFIGDPSAPPPQLLVAVDSGQSQVGGIVKSALMGAVQRVKAVTQWGPAVAAAAGRPAVVLQDDSIKQTQLTAGDIFIPGFLVYFVFFLANGVAATLLYERQEGTLRRMLSAPLSRTEILGGKLLARGILGLIQTAILIAIGAAWLHMTITSDPVGLLVTAVVTVFAAVGLGMLIATFGKTMEQIQGMTTLTLLLLGFVSGTLIPRSLLPPALITISKVTPHYWALNAYQDLIQRRLPLIDTLPNLGVVLLFGCLFFGLALARFRFE